MMNLVAWLNLRRLGFVVIFLVFIENMVLGLYDPDYFWHLRTGQYIFEQHALPAGDIFSYTNLGKPWVLHEWLSEILLYCIHTLLGPLGVKVIVSLMIITTLVIMYKTANQILNKPNVAFTVILLFFVPMIVSIGPRPQMVSMWMFAFFMHALITFKHAHTTRALWWLPPLMIVWTNAHGGYMIGIALLLIFVTCEWLTQIARQNHDVADKNRLKILSWVTVATILASLINPYFIQHWLYPFDVMNMKVSQGLIIEWQSPNFHSIQFQWYLAVLLVTMTAAMYRKIRPDLTEILVTLLFVTEGFVAVRHINFAIIALIPFAAKTITQLSFARLLADKRVKRLCSGYQKFAHNSNDMGKMEFMFNWLLLGVTVVGLTLYYSPMHSADKEKMNTMVPIKATEFIINAGINGRMFTTYHYGGYLIQSLYPTQKVFIDGRADMYGDDFIKEYITISFGAPGWQQKFEKYKIDYLVMARNTPLIELLKAQGDFKLVYEDEINAILLKDNEKFAKIIARYGR